MEIVIFEDKTWKDIPEQDNPAFDYISGVRKNNRHNECLLITKVLPYHQKCVGKEGYIVNYIPLEGEITHLGLFWILDTAQQFAENYKKEVHCGF